jgi:hypothetical protein
MLHSTDRIVKSRRLRRAENVATMAEIKNFNEETALETTWNTGKSMDGHY